MEQFESFVSEREKSGSELIQAGSERKLENNDHNHDREAPEHIDSNPEVEVEEVEEGHKRLKEEVDEVVMAQIKNHEVSSGCVEELTFSGSGERGERKAKILAEEKSGNGLSDLDEKTRVREVIVVPEKNNESESQGEEATPEKSRL